METSSVRGRQQVSHMYSICYNQAMEANRFDRGCFYIICLGVLFFFYLGFKKYVYHCVQSSANELRFYILQV